MKIGKGAQLFFGLLMAILFGGQSVVAQAAGVTAAADGGAKDAEACAIAEGAKPRHLGLEVIEVKEGIGQEWGVALSGGGLRSALFSMGALKALYDVGLLPKVDIISTVSGGGYTGYWLYTNELMKNDDQLPFGYVSLDDSSFPQRVCEVITTGNFYTYRQMAEAALPGGDSIVGRYESQLTRTFGRGDDDKVPVSLERVAPSHFTSKFPYLVINTTINNPVPASWEHSVLEMSPLLVGNSRYGFNSWSGTSLSFRKAAAISGAAFKPLLKQKIDNPLAGLDEKSLVLSDGGHSENLGAAALIRRGVRNVVVIDAEHNPRYEFSSYRNLRDILKSWGLELSVPVVDEFLRIQSSRKSGDMPLQLPVSSSAGVVRDIRSGEKISNIYYVKMSLPESIEKVIANRSAVMEGWRANRDFFDVLTATRSRASGAWDCNYIAELKSPIAPWLLYNLSSYSSYAPISKRMAALRALKWDFFYSEFPQYTTADQSFYLDQSLAFIGLGYFEATELKALVGPEMGHSD